MQPQHFVTSEIMNEICLTVTVHRILLQMTSLWPTGMFNGTDYRWLDPAGLQGKLTILLNQNFLSWVPFQHHVKSIRALYCAWDVQITYQHRDHLHAVAKKCQCQSVGSLEADFCIVIITDLKCGLHHKPNDITETSFAHFLKKFFHSIRQFYSFCKKENNLEALTT